MNAKKTFYLCSAACPRRRLDTAKIYNYFVANGLTYTKNYKKADFIIVSTCGVLKDREDQSIDAISFYSKHKRQHADLVITGCLPSINDQRLEEIGHFITISPKELERFGDIIEEEVDFGDISDPNEINDYPLIPAEFTPSTFLFKTKRAVRSFTPSLSFCKNILFKLLYLLKMNRYVIFDYEQHRLSSQNNEKDFFNIRVARGCLGNCSYCSIRFAAGRLKSKPVSEIIREFKAGLNKGHRKFIFISDDLGCYGLDIGTTIVALLEEIFQIDGDYKVIIKEFNAQWLVKYYSDIEALFSKYSDKIEYIIIPVQSAENRILKSMKRPYDIDKVSDCLSKLQKKVPSLGIVTHIMAGFPGETDDDFKKSKKFLEKFYFLFVDIYGYEDRPKTEASKMGNKVPPKIIQKRVAELKKIQSRRIKQAAVFNHHSE